MYSVSIVMLTYNRWEYAYQTLRGLNEYLDPSGVNIRLHIADDDTPGDYLQRLQDIAVGMFPGMPVSTSRTNRKKDIYGYGANYNLATQAVHPVSDYVIPIEDDWKLCKTLPVGALIADMNAGDYDCIRLGYIGYTQNLFSRFDRINNHNYLALLSVSPEPHVFAGHPRIETVKFEQEVGAWPERIGAGQTEFEVAHRDRARRGIAWPLWLIPNIDGGDLFAHIGTIKAGEDAE